MRIRTLIAAGLLAIGLALVAPSSPAAAAPPPESAHLFSAAGTGCLAARAGSGERPVIKTRCDTTVPTIYADQYWKRPSASLGIQLRSTMLGLCMAARGSGEAVVFATTCNTGWRDQIWYMIPDGRLGYQFQNANSLLCLAARGTVHQETRAVVTTCDFTQGHYWEDQHWVIA